MIFVFGSISRGKDSELIQMRLQIKPHSLTEKPSKPLTTAQKNRYSYNVLKISILPPPRNNSVKTVIWSYFCCEGTYFSCEG